MSAGRIWPTPIASAERRCAKSTMPPGTARVDVLRQQHDDQRPAACRASGARGRRTSADRRDRRRARRSSLSRSASSRCGSRISSVNAISTSAKNSSPTAARKTRSWNHRRRGRPGARAIRPDGRPARRRRRSSSLPHLPLVGLVIVAQEVQKAMEGQDPQFGAGADAPARGPGGRPRPGRWPYRPETGADRAPAPPARAGASGGKRQHVGRVVHAAELPVQPAHRGVADERDGRRGRARRAARRARATRPAPRDGASAGRGRR